MGLLCAGFVLWGERKLPLAIIVGFLVVVAALYFTSPYKIDRHIVMLEILILAGLLIEILIEYFLTQIPIWVTWSRLAASIPISAMVPFPLKESQYH